MLFNSFDFAVFFPIVVFIYFQLPSALRLYWLLFCSCYFYASFIFSYVFILFSMICVDYWAGIFIEDSRRKSLRKIYLIFSVMTTCAILFIFKYLNFINDSLSSLAQLLHFKNPVNSLHLILPIGLSFHTFQSLGYVIDVYRKEQKAERNFFVYATYVMFFPQLVAGPIERAKHLLEQFKIEHQFDYQKSVDGLRLMAWGYFKKIVIADRLAVIVDTVYNNPHEFKGAMLIIATFFFGYQVYCDFSGYTDIARGSARILGIDLMQNFRSPFASASIREFWQRWHISLSSWFRDYVYIPLGGNRVGIGRWQINILIAFALSGIWHGANWTFLIWGLLHGFYYMIYYWVEILYSKLNFLKRYKFNPSLARCSKVLTTFLLVNFSWIFFRANNISDAIYIVTHLFSGLTEVMSGIRHIGQGENLIGLREVGVGKIEYVLSFGLIIFLEFVNYLDRNLDLQSMIKKQNFFLRWSFYYFLVFAIILLGKYNPSQFIYFQF